MGPLHLAIVLGCAALISAEDAPNGKCPEIETMDKFDVDKYAGPWYDIERYPDVTLVPDSRCQSTFFDKREKQLIEMKRRMCVINSTLSIFGVAKEDSKDSLEKGKLRVGFPLTEESGEKQYFVLDTDYVGYSIVWSCKESGTDPNQKHDFSLWVLGRKPELNETQDTAVKTKLKALELDTVKFTKVDQQKCCYNASTIDHKNEPDSATSVGLSMALLLSTVMVRFL